jgi:MinD-like ATPase involved in chromosome partitioning or flagellar assembly
VDLPTYTNIWRIEKRLYKLYDFRLPAPLPITWIGVFVGITVPYVLFLIAIGLPFNHNLVWLYILPPGVLTWLTTRPVIESKRLPELVSSQLRYVAEPRTWCRMAPFAEKDEILVTARVWHQHPAKARPKKTKKVVVKARSAASAPRLAIPEAEEMARADVRPVKARRAVPKALAARQTASPPTLTPLVAPAVSPVVFPVAEPGVPPSPEQLPGQVQVPERVQVPARAPARWVSKRAKADPATRPSWSPWPFGSESNTASAPDAGQVPDTDQGPAWATPPPPAAPPAARTLEVAHDSDPGFSGPGAPSASSGAASWPLPEANLLPLVRPRPEPAPFPEAGAFPDAGPFPEAGAFPEVDAEPAPGLEHPEDADPAAPHRYGIASARRHLSGLVPSLGRKLDRSVGSPQPLEEASAQAASARPETPVATPTPMARRVLHVQARPASVPAEDRLVPAEPPLAAPTLAEPTLAEPQLAEPSPAEPLPAGPGPTPAEPEAAVPDMQVPDVQVPEVQVPEVQAPEAEAPVPPVAAWAAGVERERPLPSIERALSGPGCGNGTGWKRQVKVVAGGQGPGKQDREATDHVRARMPLAGPRRIVVLGCTRGAGQTVTALMTGHILAMVRGIPVAALDLNPGPTSLATRRSPPATSVYALLAGQPGPSGRPGPGARVDVIADPPGRDGNVAAHALDGDDFRRLADVLAERYLLTMIDPAASGLTRILSTADQLVLVAPASPDAATSLANTQEWLGAHGHAELASRAVTVVNGVSRRTQEDVVRAESVARGRCRAIVRVPWDDLLSSRPGPHQQTTLQPQTRRAYTALAGVLVTGLAAPGPVPGRNPGEHSD